jgi:hypothetical protein
VTVNSKIRHTSTRAGHAIPTILFVNRFAFCDSDP